MTEDPIIDRSPEQIKKLIAESRIAIIRYGYSIVRTEWLHQMLDEENIREAHANL